MLLVKKSGNSAKEQVFFKFWYRWAGGKFEVNSFVSLLYAIQKHSSEKG